MAALRARKALAASPAGDETWVRDATADGSVLPALLASKPPDAPPPAASSTAAAAAAAAAAARPHTSVPAVLSNKIPLVVAQLLLMVCPPPGGDAAAAEKPPADAGGEPPAPGAPAPGEGLPASATANARAKGAVPFELTHFEARFVIQNIGEQYKGRQDPVMWSGESVAKYLASLHEEAGRARCAEHAARPLAGLWCLVCLLDDKKLLAVPATLRYAAHVALLLLRRPPLREGAARVLDRLAQRGVLEAPPPPPPPPSLPAPPPHPPARAAAEEGEEGEEAEEAEEEAGDAGSRLRAAAADLLWPLASGLVAAAIGAATPSGGGGGWADEPRGSADVVEAAGGAEACRGAEAGRAAAANLLLKLVVTHSPAWLAPAVGGLDPFPEPSGGTAASYGPRRPPRAFAALRSAQAAAAAAHAPPGLRLARLAARAGALPAATRDAAAASLLAALRSPGGADALRAEAAAHAAAESSGGGSGGGGAAAALLHVSPVDAAWQIAAACGALGAGAGSADASSPSQQSGLNGGGGGGGSSLCALASEALAVLGPGDPFATAFHGPPTPAASSADALRAAALGALRRASARLNDASRAPTHAQAARAAAAIARSVDGAVGAATRTRVACEVLRSLVAAVADPDVDTVLAAVRAARSLLKTPAGGDALARLRPLERAYLDAFRPADGRTAEPAAQSASQRSAALARATAALSDDATWRPPGSEGAAEHGAWACRLGACILPLCGNFTLRVASQLAGRVPAVAELLIPHALADISVGAGAAAVGAAPDAAAAAAAGLKSLLSRQIGDHIVRNVRCSVRATSCVLEWLAFLRAKRVVAGIRGLPRTAPAAPTPAARRRNGDPKNGDGEEEEDDDDEGAAASSPASRAAARAGELPGRWAKAHWLDVDYLDCAAAALRAGAPLTALQYTELFADDARNTAPVQHGATTHGGDTDAFAFGGDGDDAPADGGSGGGGGGWAGADVGPLPRAVALSLAAHAASGELDGPYAALGRSTHAVLRRARAAHERRWGDALSSADAELSSIAASSAVLTTARARGGGSGEDAAAAAAVRVAEALQGLGAHAAAARLAPGLAAAFAQSATGGAVAAAAQLAEIGAEAAWRLGRWGGGGGGADGDAAAAGLFAYTVATAGEAAAAIGGAASDGADLSAGAAATARPPPPAAAAPGFHASFLAALAALRRRELPRCEAALGAARAAALRSFALTSSAESAPAAHAAVVRLQALREASDVCAAAAAAAATGAAAAASSAIGASTALASSASSSAWFPGSFVPDGSVAALTAAWDGAHAAPLLGKWDLVEPLLAARAAALSAAGATPGAVAALATSAGAARVAARPAEGLDRVEALKRACCAVASSLASAASAAAATPGVAAAAQRSLRALCGPDAAWRDEEARLLWDCGQHALALGAARGVAAALPPPPPARAMPPPPSHRKSKTPGKSQGGGGAAVHTQPHPPLDPDALSAAVRRAALLTTLGGWVAARRAAGGAAIRTDFFEAAVDTLRRVAPSPPTASPPAFSSALCDAHFALAQFLDATRRGLEARMSSPEWATAAAIAASNAAEMAALEARQDELRRSLTSPAGAAEAEGAKKSGLVRQIYERIKSLKAALAEDEAERAGVAADAVSARRAAAGAYADALASGSSHDGAALYRLIALWFGGDAPRDADVNARMLAAAGSARGGGGGGAPGAVPSAKFLPLAWQLVARLGPVDPSGATCAPGAAGATAAPGGDAAFQQSLRALCCRLAVDHPYHATYVLMAAAAAATVGDNQLASRAALAEKAAAATAVLDSARAASPRHAALATQMAAMVKAYVSTALLKVCKAGEHPPPAGHVVKLPRDAAKCPPLPLVPITSVSLPVDPTCEYPPGSFPSFFGFKGDAVLVGGINAPRKLTALGSDGRAYPQLAKGRDDLRQDAVMQQVFGLASELLSSSPAARARRLRMHTYKVVQFSPLAGLVEWVEHTVPLSAYLVSGSASAHSRLRPGDIDTHEARTRMEKAIEKDAQGGAGGRAARARAAFDAVCDRFQPVMRHFFLEMSPSAAVWYEKRLAYTRSVAVASMVVRVGVSREFLVRC